MGELLHFTDCDGADPCSCDRAGLPLTTGEGNTAQEKLRYIATGDGDFRPLTSDDAKALLAEYDALREQLDAARQALERIAELDSPHVTSTAGADKCHVCVARAALGVEGPAG